MGVVLQPPVSVQTDGFFLAWKVTDPPQGDVFLYRSTYNLSTIEGKGSLRPYPVTVIPVENPFLEGYTDRNLPLGVTWYYQMVVKKRKPIRSNVVSARLPPAKRLAPPIPSPSIQINKSTYILTLLSEGNPIKRYPIVLGTNPFGRKEREGDGATPEGTYYICTKRKQSRFGRFLVLSYPGEEDAERGAREGVITDRDKAFIVDAVRKRKLPPQDTPLGGMIGLHGGGLGLNWTDGSVALRDGDIRELFTLVPTGTSVVIFR